MTSKVPSKGLEWINLIAGGSFACAAVFFGQEAAVWNAATVGILVVCFSTIALCRYADWAEWFNAALGGWALIAPFLLGFSFAKGTMWTHVLAGICIATIAVIQLANGRKRSSPVSHAPH